MSGPILHVTDSSITAPRCACGAGVPPVTPLVQMILSQPGMADRLMAEHADDGRGRCLGCPVGGQQGRHAWPCTIRQAAEEAERLDRARSA